MKIVTVNLPVSYLNAIETLTGENGLYPSRSELIRVAVRDFLIRDLEAAKTFKKYHEMRNQSELVFVGDQTYRLIEKPI